MTHQQRPKVDKQRTEAQQLEDDIRDTVSVFACASETSEDCATECERRLSDVEADLNYRRVAHDIWKGRTGRVQVLVTAMADLITENERHRQAIAELLRRFDALADQHLHEHIEHPENHLEIVRALFNPPQAP